MKHTLSLLLVLALLCCLAFPALAAEETQAGGFQDVPADSWYAPYVDLAAQIGIMIGTGDGTFEPERELTQTECLTLALRLYDLCRGGEGALETAPVEWGRITLTLSDGTVVSGYGQERGGEDPGGLWRLYSTAGMFGYGTQRRALRCTVTAQETERINALEDKSATIELNGKTYPGIVHCWFPNSEWVMDFEPTATADNEDVYREIWDAVLYGADPANWFRDTVYSLWAMVPEAERGGFAGVDSWYLGVSSALRQDFASAVAAAAGELEAINEIDRLPDTKDEVVLGLYRAGILNGVDTFGSFAPERTLTRAEAAAMVARVLHPALRLRAGEKAPESELEESRRTVPTFFNEDSVSVQLNMHVVELGKRLDLILLEGYQYELPQENLLVGSDLGYRVVSVTFGSGWTPSKGPGIGASTAEVREYWGEPDAAPEPANEQTPAGHSLVYRLEDGCLSFRHQGDGVITEITLANEESLTNAEETGALTRGLCTVWKGDGDAIIAPFDCFGDLVLRAGPGPYRFTVTDADGTQTVLAEGEGGGEFADAVPAPQVSNGALCVSSNSAWAVEIHWVSAE